MTDDGGRKRDTPTGLGPARPNPGPLPKRGAGLSGNLPAGSRFDKTETRPGMSPVTIQDERSRAEPRRGFEPIPSGPWEAMTTPPRSGPPEPLPAASRPPMRGPDPAARAGAEAFAPTRPADIANPMRARDRAIGSRDRFEPPAPPRAPDARPNPRRPLAEAGSRAPSHRPTVQAAPGMRPGVSPSPPEPNPSLRLKLDVDPYDVAHEGARVRVPKRRAPLVLGALIVLGTFVGAAVLWIEGHGGFDNFVAQLGHVIAGEPATTPPSAATPPPAVAATVPTPAAAPAATAAAPGQAAPAPAASDRAAAPAAPAATAAQAASAPATSDRAAPPASDESQIATGEIEPPEEPGPDEGAASGEGAASEAERPQAARAPAADAPPQQTAAATAAAEPAKPEPKPKPAAKPAPRRARERVARKPPEPRDPVIRIEELGAGDITERVLSAPPPDPSGGPVLPPPDPPAPE